VVAAAVSLAVPVRTKAELLRLWDEATEKLNAIWPIIPAHRFAEVDKALFSFTVGSMRPFSEMVKESLVNGFHSPFATPPASEADSRHHRLAMGR
jgi:hypothetical protein